MMRILFFIFLANILCGNRASCKRLRDYRMDILALHANARITQREKKELLGAINRQLEMLMNSKESAKLHEPKFVDIAPERILQIAQMLPIDTLDYSSFEYHDNSNAALARFSKNKGVDAEKLRRSVLYQVSCQRAENQDKILLEIMPVLKSQAATGV